MRVGLAPVVVAGHAGKQPGAARWPVLAHGVLLGADRRRGLGAERDQLFGPDLGGLKPQARPAAAVGEHRVEREVARVPAAHPGLHDDHDEVAGGGVRDLRQGLIGFQLGHHVLGDEPGDLVVVEGKFFDVDGGAGGKSGEPAVAVAGLEEHPDHRQGQRPGGGRVSLGEQPGQVILQDRPGDRGQAVASGWQVARNRENRVSASAPLPMVVKAHPVARRNRDQRLTASRSHGWPIWSKRAWPRPRRAGMPRRPAFQRSEAHSPSRAAASQATTWSRGLPWAAGTG